jgi:hypothetical protein
MNTVFNKLASIYENEDNWEYGKSEIEGMGIFANKEIPEHTIIGKATNPFEAGKLITTTGMGSKINHAWSPNCQINRVISGNMIHHTLSTLWDIEQGEELTVDYRGFPEFKDPDPDWK